MASKAKFQAIRGTRDLLPAETALWNHVEETAREIFGTYGFGEIRPPIFEPTELFARAVGGETDIVSKEMYTFFDNPDVLELEAAKYAITSSAGRTDGFFLLLVGDFLKKIHARMTAGEINLPAQAESDLEVVKSKFREMQAPEDRQGEEAEQRRREMASVICLRVELLKFGERVSLRPEATASVCRAYIEHNMQQLPQPVKLYYMGPMFRRERPQKGRYRQFYQIGAEVLERQAIAGSKEAASADLAAQAGWRAASESPEQAAAAKKEFAKDAATDAEVIEMLVTFFDRVGLEGAELSINSIGHNAENCRRGYAELLRNKLREVKDKLGADSQRRIETNPLRVLDSKLEHEQPIIATLPKIADHFCYDCKAHYAELKQQLNLRGVKYAENWRLVRGLDYYMGTTFEITASGLGSQNAVCGGGRYDGLVELLGGPPTKGIGFAIGEDRLILSLQESHREVASGPDRIWINEWRVASGRTGVDVYVAWMGAAAYETAIRAAKTLRAAGVSVELPPSELKFGKALERASKLGAKYALILGDNEVQSGEWTLKALADGTQEKLTEPRLLEYLRRRQ